MAQNKKLIGLYFMKHGLIFLVLFLLLLTSCSRRSKLRLDRIDDVVISNADTIKYFSASQIYLLQIVTERAFGKMKFDYLFLRAGSKSGYKIEYDHKLSLRFSDRYTAFAKEVGSVNWGWYYLQNGNIQDQLPFLDILVDSLRKVYSERCHVQHSNGYFSIYSEGQHLKDINYGDMIIHEKINYDSLEHKLYKLENHHLVVVSSEVNGLKKQQDGVFFVPPPGLELIAKYKNEDILNALDSVIALTTQPNKIIIAASYNP